ncbi:ribonuclease HII [Acidiphilium sp. PA]|uniref:ribonuclease HII n=1 Tax=Acidiphilium sp. PA TaxID=2871705 RepID=UPI002243422C|nr:ribonuclease HII [Acidiphilium sp. PA]MCW8306309.1 ribonuclease HII [Acidiphilium sp. PA]
MPDFSYERRCGGIVAGVDEVGRGPLAGPVLAAAAILPLDIDATIMRLIDDSKRLSAARRAVALAALIDCGAVIALGAASVAEIARLNILQASLLAMRRAVARLTVRPDHVLVDGNMVPSLPMNCSALVGGDGISLSIAAASIAAKLARDQLMVRLDRRYPGYGWAQNAGYGTQVHRAAIVSRGITAHHRCGFGPLLRDIARPV